MVSFPYSDRLVKLELERIFTVLSEHVYNFFL